MARKFFYVCAGLFLLAGAYAFGARNAGAGAPGNQEVAVLTGQVSDGGTISLPHYQDGSEALESECRWTVSPEVMAHGLGPVFQRCSTQGRTVRVYWCPGHCGPAGDCVPQNPGCGPEHSVAGGTANYLIIAVRNLTPTSSQSGTIGAIKAQYR